MSVINILLKTVWCLSMQWVFIHSSNAFKFNKNIFFILMVNLEVFVTIVIWAFIRQKTYQLIY